MKKVIALIGWQRDASGIAACIARPCATQLVSPSAAAPFARKIEMNANFGIVLQKVDRDRILLPAPPRLRTWGDEVVREDAADRYAFEGLDEVEFVICPVTNFIRSRLPEDERAEGIEYAWMTGAGLEKYERWVAQSDTATPRGRFETAFATLLGRLRFWAVLLAPENDRLAKFSTVSSQEMLEMLRGAVRDLAASDGFLAIRKDISCPSE